MTRPNAFDSAALAVDGDTVHLRGARCSHCGRLSFPTRPACPACGASTTPEQLPDTGAVYACVTTELPLAGAEPPVTVMLVDLTPHVRVQGLATRPAAIGATVRLVARTVAGSDGDAVGYGFAPGDDDA